MPDGRIDASEDAGLAPGPPDPDGYSHYLQDDELSAIIRTLDASPATLALSRTLRDQMVWVVDVRLPTSPDAPVDRIRIVVDQRRMLPVEVSRSVKGAVIQRKRFSDLRLASSVGRGTFRIEFPAGVSSARFDNGFQRTQPPAVRQLVGYAPVTPGWLPSGYELATIAVLPGSPPGLQATAGGDNPPNRDVVSLAYRRGIEQLTVTVRRVADPNKRWKDPFLTGIGATGRVQRLRLDAGRFLGTSVEQVTEPGGPAHLWGRTPELVFTVAGDLNPSQLLRVANSLS